MPSTLPKDTESITRQLRGLAYRMTGSVAEAEDILQEAWLKYLAAPESVELPSAYVRQIVLRLCLDRMKSARVQRVDYIGPWLPEPVIDEEFHQTEALNEIASDISFGLLLTLERLSPAERAAFLLRDVFEVEFAEIAAALGVTEVNCRQLASRAREKVRSDRQQKPSDKTAHATLAAAFFSSVRIGDPRPILELLTNDATLYSDGGGKRSTALRPIFGAERIARYFAGVARRWPPQAWLGPQTINGHPGALLRDTDGNLFAIALETVGTGHESRVQRVFVLKNPEKLHPLENLLAHSSVVAFGEHKV